MRTSSAYRQKFLTLPVLCAASGQFFFQSSEGELKTLDVGQAQFAVHGQSVMVCHSPYTANKLGNTRFNPVDILELFAFVHPTRFCVPTPAGIAKSLHLETPADVEDYPSLLVECVQALLDGLKDHPEKERLLLISELMGLQGRGWYWTPHVFSALGEVYEPEKQVIGRTALNVWKKLPEWAEALPQSPPSHLPVGGQEARDRLKTVLARDFASENRAPQMNYTTRLVEAFTPRDDAGQVNAILAEAGTGVGKTLGYLVPATIWSEKNDAPVWISTYTRNLQRQIETELHRIYPDPDVRNSKTAVRKGRENYLCLLNYDDLAAGAGLALQIRPVIAAGLMARWISETRNGDLTGSDFPGWLSGLLGYQFTTGLADRRGECIFSACDHYKKCFTERAIRKAKQVPLVVANHAVVMHQAALAGPEDDLPQRYIFDEGHHLFDAADSAFAAHLSGQQSHDMRRWIVGPEGTRRSRARGLRKRLEDVLTGDDEGNRLLNHVIHASRFLHGEDWLTRMKSGNTQGTFEQFIDKVFHQVQARNDISDSPYSLETPSFPLITGLLETSDELKADLKILQAAMVKLSAHLRLKMDQQAETLSADDRKRLDAVSHSLDRRSKMTLSAWIAMLETLESGLNPVDWVDWMAIEKTDGKVFDVGMYRHHIDPTKPFASAIRPHSHSVIVTSATLQDARAESSDTEVWNGALAMTGVAHLSEAPLAFSIPSPFDYAEKTRVLVVTDIRKNDIDQLSVAYRELFQASGGGGLGLFTSIQRLRAVHARIEDALSRKGIPLYAQHVDGIDSGTLVDIFREDIASCLLGTDAVRDGVDVPGHSLRLIVFDRVPWPRATLLHKARKKVLGGGAYDDRLTRLKIKQAYGRLIRRVTDRGIFVMLDSALPQRLQTAFPEGVAVERVGLSDAIRISREFLKSEKQ